MVLHQAQSPLPLYLPIQYQTPTPRYNFAYEVNNPHARDFKSQQEDLRGDKVLGQYSLLKPEGITRTVDYRADDDLGFDPLVNHDRRHSDLPVDRQVEDNNDGAGRQNNGGLTKQSSPTNSQPASQVPVTITQTALYHHFYSKGHKSRN